MIYAYLLFTLPLVILTACSTTEPGKNPDASAGSPETVLITYHIKPGKEKELLGLIKMILIHDIVEIEVGDTYACDAADNFTNADRENRASERICGLLPAVQATELSELWQEFEFCVSPEAVFVNAPDRIFSLIQNYHNGGKPWRDMVPPTSNPPSTTSRLAVLLVRYGATPVRSSSKLKNGTFIPLRTKILGSCTRDQISSALRHG